VNPYACANPYARPAGASSNPYAKKASAKTLVEDDIKMPASGGKTEEMNQLWVDKYKPSTSMDILGNQDSARKLATWLAQWEERFNNAQAIGKTFSNPQGPWKAALLSGPPGIGSKWDCHMERVCFVFRISHPVTQRRRRRPL
jgi:replication factor C subunit 1